MSFYRTVRRALLGDALSNSESSHQRLSNPIALAVFSSDAISSVAYATQEILLVLALAGAAFLTLAWPIALAIGGLLTIVTMSYRQTIKAYPQGGGSYSVAKENLGAAAGLTAGASLLTDYVLTVAVSVSAGIAAITSAFPALYPYRVEIALASVFLLMLANLRGVKESGAVFSVPTFAFIGLLGATIAIGLFRYFTGGAEAIAVPPGEHIVAVQGLGVFLIAKAFSSGCTAMTGVEAIANGVAVFKEPTATNARRTLTAMAGILLFLFLGLSFLAVQAGVRPSETETVISQLSRAIYGTGLMYYSLSFATMAILIVAANTAYADFPRLMSFMATDDFVPHQFQDKGHRLVFSNGIIILSVVAAVLIAIFSADVSGLIPLYAVGVFAAFTLSQSGMCVHWLGSREAGWQRSIAVNATGAIVTGGVTLTIAVSKFSGGAWMVLVIIPTLMGLMFYVRHHYGMAAKAAAVSEAEIRKSVEGLGAEACNHVVVLAKRVDRRLLDALRFSTLVAGHTRHALHLDIKGDAEEFKAAWAAAGIEMPLMVIDSPYREFIGPVVDHVRSLVRSEGDIVTVVVSEFLPDDAHDYALHSQAAMWLKYALSSEPHVVIVDVPFRFED